MFLSPQLDRDVPPFAHIWIFFRSIILQILWKKITLQKCVLLTQMVFMYSCCLYGTGVNSPRKFSHIALYTTVHLFNMWEIHILCLQAFGASIKALVMTCFNLCRLRW